MPAPPDPDAHAPNDPVATVKAHRLDLSVAQLLGSTAAAVTAAFLGSRLGVAGTLVGAALASVVSVVAGAIYTHSIRVTRQRVHRTLQLAQPHVEPSHGEPSHGRPSQQPSGLPQPPSRPTGRRRPTLRVTVASALAVVAVFAVTLGIITGVEKVSGRDLSGSTGSLSVLGGRQAEVTGSSAAPSSSAPTTNPTPTSSAVTGESALSTTPTPSRENIPSAR